MMEERQPKTEVTGWRDEAISKRHKLYGFHLPMVDIDFLNVEYSSGHPYALVEYKTIGAKISDSAEQNWRALIELADRADLPSFLARYNRQTWAYDVRPLNARAARWVPQESRLCEADYVRLLYRLRGQTAPAEVLARLQTGK